MPQSILIELHYLGSFAYYALFFSGLPVEIEACEHYQKGSYRNRCHLATAQGPQALSLALQGGKHQQKPIREVRLDDSADWARQHRRTLQTLYGSAPFWEHYGPELLKLYENPPENLFDWNLQLFDWIWKRGLRQSQTAYTLSTQYQAKGNSEIWDLRNALKPQQTADWPLPYYPQIFEDRQGFLSNLSLLDALFCMGGPWCLQQLKILGPKLLPQP